MSFSVSKRSLATTLPSLLKINIAGRVIGIAGTVLSLFMQAKEDYDAEKRVKEQRNAREQIRAAYNSVAEELENHFSKALTNWGSVEN